MLTLPRGKSIGELRSKNHWRETDVRDISYKGFDGVDGAIDGAARRRMVAGIKGQTTYKDAMAAIAKEQPQLFLARERLRLSQQVTPDETIYFDFVNGPLGGALVNPAVIRDGKFVPLDSPLSGDKQPLSRLDSAQDVASLVAEKMEASDGKLDYARALKLVASEHPALVRRYRSGR
jgi:hypothetical protein